MAGSYLKFNYNVRASKSIERRMILEVLREFCPLSVVDEYCYIGFGSIFYTDFRLFHKELNIKKMICIEADEEEQARFEFNKPYQTVDLKMGKSSEVLPVLDWAGKKIVWLDYDGKMEAYMFDDLRTVITQLEIGSFFMITCNANPSSYRKETSISDEELAEFRKEYKDFINLNIDRSNFTNSKIIPLIHSMIRNAIDKYLSDRNAALPQSNKINFIQLFNFKYQDNSPMYTFGGILSGESKPIILESIKHHFDYIKSNQDIYEIGSPIVTNKEVDIMNSKLPNEKDIFLELSEIGFIPNNHKEAYFKLYRYHPNYMEIRDF